MGHPIGKQTQNQNHVNSASIQFETAETDLDIEEPLFNIGNLG